MAQPYALAELRKDCSSPGGEGYVEFLTPAFAPDPRPRKSTLSTGRLIYCFSHAAVLDPAGPGLAAARHGVDYLLKRCANPDGGFYRSLNEDGSPLDDRADLGDLGFVLFGLGWYHRASGDRQALEIAETTMRFIETRLASPPAGSPKIPWEPCPPAAKSAYALARGLSCSSPKNGGKPPGRKALG